MLAAPQHDGGDPAHRSNSVSSITSVTSDTEGPSDGTLPPDPLDILIERCQGWESLLQALVYQFEIHAEAEKGFVTSNSKVQRHWHSDNPRARQKVFAETTGIANFEKGIKEAGQALVTEHENLYTALHTTTIPGLKGIAKEVQQKMDTMESEQKVRRKEKQKDERALKAQIKKLAKSLQAARGASAAGIDHSGGDPWEINLGVRKHLLDAAHKYHLRTDNIKATAESFGSWETNITNQIRGAIEAYTTNGSAQVSSASSASIINNAITSLNAAADWESFKTTRLTEAVAPNAFNNDYPGSDDPLVQIVKEGPIMRKSKLLKKWKESWWVLVASGWLHEYKTRPILDGSEVPSPSISIWLGNCTLTPLSMPDTTAEEFHVIERKNGLLSKKSNIYKYTTNSMSDSQAWWNQISTLTSSVLSVNNRMSTNGTTLSNATASSQNTLTEPKDEEQKRVSTLSSASSFASAEENLPEQQPHTTQAPAAPPKLSTTNVQKDPNAVPPTPISAAQAPTVSATVTATPGIPATVQ